MIGAMLLAHLVGDFVLQWDKLASWKSRELKGVLAHGTVVFIVTWLFSLPFDPTWWRGVVFIGITHIFIDAIQLYVKPPIPALLRFTLDQIAHFTIILIALIIGGFIETNQVLTTLLPQLQSEKLLMLLIGYAFVTMPAWVIAKFLAYGLVKGAPPNFPEGSNKYLGILERILVTTFVALGQFLLIPLITLPRLVLEWPGVIRNDRGTVYLVEFLFGIVMAIMTGLAISQL
ncbi:MAG: DUF3307 domain-containing protein [Ardenticatenaceae bacterium]|nr:DUF3307 domain-containing protein [Anaerolineales bacterium]MCB8923607.1 DUF3307 domain-containing protein [Ardenticatenaceae bacterium]